MLTAKVYHGEMISRFSTLQKPKLFSISGSFDCQSGAEMASKVTERMPCSISRHYTLRYCPSNTPPYYHLHQMRLSCLLQNTQQSTFPDRIESKIY